MKIDKENLKALALLNQVGLTMIIPIMGCLFIGIFLDRQLSSEPLFLFIFMFLGIGVAFRNLYQLMKRMVDKKKKRP